MKKHFTILSLILLVSCQGAHQFTVNHYGVLREIMRKQKLDPNANLQTYARNKNLYALGALEGLSGEIIVIGGKAYHGLIDNDQLQVTRGFDYKATLLVTAEVKAWTELALDLEWSNLSELETHIKEAAQQLGLDVSQPFPFRLKGTVDQIDWHIINAPAARSQNHDAYREAGAHGRENNATGQLLGFYSEQHEGVFTHHGSYLHTHWLSEDKKLVAHIDGLAHNGKITLLLPKP